MLTEAECDHLDNKVTGWMATSLAATALGGVSGIVTSVPSDQTSRWIISGVSLLFGATAAVASYLSTHFAARYTKQCTVNIGGH